MPTNVYDVTQPPDTQLANLLGLDLRNLALNVQQRMALISGTLAGRWDPSTDAQPANWTGLLYFATDTSQIFQWSGSAWVDITSAIGLGHYKFEGSNIVPVTVANTITNTVLQSISIPANDIGAGQAFYFEASGVAGCVTGPGQAFTLTITLGGVVIGTFNFSFNTANNQSWFLRGFFSGLTIGATGTVTGANCIWASSFSLGGFQSNATGVGQPPQSVVINTTNTNILALSAQWGVANAGDTITQNFMNCYRMG
jgi:hypothetical protein